MATNMAPHNLNEVTDAICALKTDPEEAARMGGNARALGESRFDRAESYKEIVRLAEGLIEGTAK